jgi:hypothetical protein
LNRILVFLLLILQSSALAQAPQSKLSVPDQKPAADPKPGIDSATAQDEIPTKTLEFKIQETDPGMSVSPITVLPSQCTPDGTVFLDMLKPTDPSQHTVLSVQGKKSQTYSPSAISDLHDIRVMNFFPSDSVVGFLVRASKELPGAPGSGKSPAGIPWDKYHNYIAEFDRDGSYRESIELPLTYQLSHFAILPSGEFLASGYDELNATPRLLFLNSSGEVVRNLDLPAFRSFLGGNLPFRSGESMTASGKLLGSVLFTAYKQHILVWRMDSNDPVLDVGPGGSVREVPLQTPQGFVFVDMIAASDRWVAHFRSAQVPEHSQFNQTDYSYYEVRPQDASLSAKLMQSGVAPLVLSCESEGTYLAFKTDKDGKFILLVAN